MINKIERFYEKIMYEPNTGCWLWTAAYNEGGYGILRINKKNVRAHRLSYEMHVGPIPEGLFVCHKCDTPACCNPTHLFIEKYRGHNDQDRCDKGRTAKGNRLPQSKLTTEKVKEIRFLYKTGKYTQQKLAYLYDIHQVTLHDIIKRITWKHVE